MSDASEAATAPSEVRSASTRSGLFGGVPQRSHGGGPTLGATHQGALLRGGDTYDTLTTPELKQSTADQRNASMLLATELADSLLGQVAAEARTAARSQGYSVGWAEGRRVAAAEAAQVAQEVAALNAETEAHRAQEHDAAVAGLVKAANEVRSLLQSLATRIEGQASGLAWELTAALMDREVAVAESSDVVRRVLKVLPDTGLATVRLHPSLVSEDAVAPLREAGVTLIADPSLSPVDALVETDGSIADLRISEAVERVRQVLA